MKKSLLLFAFSWLLFGAGFAQSSQSIAPSLAPITIPGAEVAPGVTPTVAHSPLTPALWDIQFNFNASDTLNAGGIAGIVWTGTEFWASIWSSDTLYTLDMNGSMTSKFTVPGLSGTRSLTTDGTNLYAGNASTTVTIINPTTKLSTGSITVPVAARHCAYDATLNSGSGGLWVGNWSTDIVAVSLTGTTLSTITAATHGMTAMYGSAFDGQTAGGPYLWVFDQSTSGNQSDIVRLQLPAGTPTIVVHDVMSDIGMGGTSGLAGGLFITNGLVSGQWTIGGMLQGTPSNLLFGYELNDFVQPAVDAQMNSGGGTEGYTELPQTHASAVSFTATIENKGTDPLAAYGIVTEIRMGATTLNTDTQSGTNLASGATVSSSSAPYNFSTVGLYDIVMYSTVTGAQMDTINGNDTLHSYFMITDTTYSRIDSTINGSLGIGGGANPASGIIGQEFEMLSNDTLTSISFVLNAPTVGDTVWPMVLPLAAGVPDDFNPLTTLPAIVISDPNPTTFTVVVPNGLAMSAGDRYVVAIREGAPNNMTLGTSPVQFTPGKGWVYLDSQGAWANSEDFNFEIAYAIFAHTGTTVLTGQGEVNELAASVHMFPNPTTGNLSILFGLKSAQDVSLRVRDLSGRLIQTIEKNGVTNDLMNIDLSKLSNGVYMVEVSSGDLSVTRKIQVMK